MNSVVFSMFYDYHFLRMLSPSLLLLPVTFAYKQCLLQFVHHADVWYAAARYLEGVGSQLAEKQVQSTQAIAFPIPYKFKFLQGLYLADFPFSQILHYYYIL